MALLCKRSSPAGASSLKFWCWTIIPRTPRLKSSPPLLERDSRVRSPCHINSTRGLVRQAIRLFAAVRCAACHPLLVFLDADVRLAPGGLAHGGFSGAV